MSGFAQVRKNTKRQLLAFMEATGTHIYVGNQFLRADSDSTSRRFQFHPPDGYRFRARGLNDVTSYSGALEKMQKGFQTCASHEKCRAYWKQFGEDEAAILALLNAPAPQQEMIEDIFGAHKVPCWFFAERNGTAYQVKK